MALCYSRGRFLYEARPDLFPEGRVTTTEIVLWGMYYDNIKERTKTK